MSPKLVTIGHGWDKLSTQEQKAAKSAMLSINAMQKRADKFITSTLKWGAALAGSAIGLGFAEAFSLEGYRSQLETATKDTQRAAEVMSYAINLANKTPFEGGEMASAASALEMASLKTETYLTTLGDTAAGANRKISEVQAGFIKAFSTGDITDFLKSINVSSAAFKEFTRENKLSTASLEDTQVALKQFLDERFGGGMEKLARTTKGAWSTITGVTKSALAQIVGMGVDGSVRTGSALDLLRGKAIDLSNMLVQWQEDGTIQRIAEEAGSALSTVWDIGEKVFTTLYKFRNLIGGFAIAAGGIWAMQKAMTAFKIAVDVARVASTLLKGTLISTPFGLVAAALGIIGLTAVSIANGTAEEDYNKQYGSGEIQHENAKRKREGALSSVSDKPKTAEELAIADGMTQGEIARAKRSGDWIKIKKKYESGSAVSKYANGTQYHTGGLALVGERGPELVELPSGSRVTTAERTANMRDKITVNNYITISGAERSDEELADMVARRIVEEAETVW